MSVRDLGVGERGDGGPVVGVPAGEAGAEVGVLDADDGGVAEVVGVGGEREVLPLLELARPAGAEVALGPAVAVLLEHGPRPRQ
jgi:hypothetical protein